MTFAIRLHSLKEKILKELTLLAKQRTLTTYIILECSYYSEKNCPCFEQLLNKTQRRLHIKEQVKRVDPDILEENINYKQSLGSPTTTINWKNILCNILLKNTSKAQKQQIESIVYQIRAKIYSKRNNE